ncbi:MAG: thioredoxin family protein [Phycisphaerae bacterium]|nr:thioredoxin family protein [Phycisphaerae bacterium]
MKSLVLSVALIALTAGMAVAKPVEGFLTDYQSAETLAKKENKPLYLHFTTDWCTWCRRIENDIYKTPEGEKVLEPFVKASLDCTVPDGAQPTGAVLENLRMMQKYGGQGFPFLVMVTPDGNVLGRINGYLPIAQFQTHVDEALKQWDIYKRIQACKSRGETNSLAYHQDCLTFYLEARNFPLAAQAAKDLQKLDPKGEKTDAAQIAIAQLYGVLTESNTQAGNPDLAKIDALRKTVAISDPKNQKGFLEQAYFASVTAWMIKGQNKTPEQLQEVLRNMETLLMEMIQNVPTLSNPLQVYGTLYNVQAKQGKFDEAIQALEAVKKLAPEGVDLAKIDAKIQELRDAKNAQPAAKEK